MLPLPAQAAIAAPEPAGASGGSSSKSARGPLKDTMLKNPPTAPVKDKTVKNPPTAEGRWYSFANQFPVKPVVLVSVCGTKQIW